MNNRRNSDTGRGEVQWFAWAVEGNLQALFEMDRLSLPEHPQVAESPVILVSRVAQFPASGEVNVIEQFEVPH
ncbi:MAG TPA: hypothetical protein VF815_33835 [Myxococcaceae bacterium]